MDKTKNLVYHSYLAKNKIIHAYKITNTNISNKIHIKLVGPHTPVKKSLNNPYISIILICSDMH